MDDNNKRIQRLIAYYKTVKHYTCKDVKKVK